MTVYFITNGVNRVGGTERVIVQLAKLLSDVIIIVPGNQKFAFNGFEDLKILSLDVGEFPDKGKLKKIVHRFEYLNEIRKKIAISSKDIVISFSFDLNVMNVILSKSTAHRVILCEHIEYDYHKGIRNSIRKFFYRQEKVQLVCLTETDTQKFIADNIDTITIPNFINPIESHYIPNRRKLLSIGRLEYQKNFSFLIESFNYSRLYEKGWTLDIIGEGSEYDALQNMITQLKLNNFITIHKFTKDINRFYDSATILCMTSRFEAFPMVLLEAMNHGLPVLVTDFPTGAKEILGLNNPQIVKKYDIHSYADELIYSCNDPEVLATYSVSNKRIVGQYYPDNIVRKWKEILK